MKFSIPLVLIVFAITFDSFCQIPGYREDTSVPTFDLNFLILKSSDKPEKEFRFFETALADFLEEFPDPDKNEDYYFEIGEEMARLISYDDNNLYFLDGELSDFKFNDGKFSIGNGVSFIKVGDHYSLLEKLFPSSENNIDYLENENFRRIFITLSNGEIVLDDGLLIFFDIATGVITKILL